jgi:hypothetical protein
LKKDARVVDAFVAASGKPAETKATPEQSVNSSAPASVLKELYAQSHALVIGVSNYRNGYPNLSGVRDDVPAVTTALLQHGFQVETLLDPTRAEFDTAMRKFISSYGDNPNNRLLVYFAGHGHTLNKGDGVNQGYIVPSDAPLPSHDLAGFKRTAISMDEIEVYALQIEAKHAMFVFDSAFSGAIFDTTRGVSAKGNGYPARAPVSVDAGIRNAIPDIILNDLKYPVRMFFTAGTAEQMVPDESIFRKQFVKGLEGAADINVDGYVTGSELGIFLQDTVAQYSRGRQTPLWGKIRNMRLNRGDFVFASPKTAPSSR